MEEKKILICYDGRRMRYCAILADVKPVMNGSVIPNAGEARLLASELWKLADELEAPAPNEVVKKGWGHPLVSRKFHYFDNTPESKDRGTSLCGKVGFYLPGETGLDDTMDEHPDNCAECQRRKHKLDLKKAKE